MPEQSEKPKIAGYRNLTESEIELINYVKEQGEQVRALTDRLEHSAEIDKRWLAIAKTDLQKGFMALTRSIAKPTTFA